MIRRFCGTVDYVIKSVKTVENGLKGSSMGKKNKQEKGEKTNVMRLLEQHKIPYLYHRLEDKDVTNGEEVAHLLGEDPRLVFKTLVTVGSRTKDHFVFVIPVAEELDLKKAAKAVGEKSIAMIKSKELLPLTGYIHGGCSPIGMKKSFVTIFDISAKDKEKIYFSGGKVGYQVEIAPADLPKILHVQYEDLVKEEMIKEE